MGCIFLFFQFRSLESKDPSSLDFIENISYEIHEGKQVLGSGIRSEATDVSFTSCHEHPLHSYFEDQLYSMQGKIQLRQQYWDKHMT